MHRLLKAWTTPHRRGTRVALFAASLSAVGCGGSTGPSFVVTDSANGGGGSSSSSGAASGGESNAGTSSGSATSGGAQNGGASNGGSANGGAGATAPVPCFDSAGQLVPEAKSCEVDADCEALPTSNCCGAGVIVALATRARAYEACYPYPTGCPQGLGCASFPSTEDGQPAGYGTYAIKVSCAAVDGGAKSCRTVSQNASEGTLWSCTCSGRASCCAPAGGMGAL